MVINLEASTGFVIHSNNVLPQTIQKHITSLNFEVDIVSTSPETEILNFPENQKSMGAKDRAATISYKKGTEEVRIDIPAQGMGSIIFQNLFFPNHK